MKEKIISLLIVLSMAVTAVSCAKPADTAVETNSANTTAADALTEEEGTTGRSGAKANLPDVKFDGSDFRVAQNKNVNYEFYCEALDGEVTNDALYNRNKKVEETYGINLVSVEYSSGGETINQTVSTVLAGDNAYELVSAMAYMSYTPISNGIYQNWLDVEYVDFSQPWWNTMAIDGFTFNGKMFTATGEINITSLLYTNAIFANLRLAESYGISAQSLYDDVYGSDWTIDRLMELSSNVYVDNNGDSVKNVGDTFGWAAWAGVNSDTWLPAFNQPISSRDEEGWPTADGYLTEKTVSILQKIIDFYYDATGSFVPPTAEGEIDIFAAGEAVFIPSIFNDAFNTFRFMEDNYTILPYPKWDSAQEKYLTGARDQYTVLGIPLTVSELDFIGIITEALAVESYRTVYPAYYDVALKSKYSNDADTAEMIEIIMNGQNFDFAFLFGEKQFSRLPYIFRDMLNAKDPDITSKFAKIEKALSKSVVKIQEFYQ